MTEQTKHDQMADKIANIDLDKEPANAHEERLQNLKRFFLEADYKVVWTLAKSSCPIW